MNQWINHSHPRTLQSAVMLGYISAVFTLLLGGHANQYINGGLAILIALVGLGFGSFATANNKTWGYALLATSATIMALTHSLFFLLEAHTLISEPYLLIRLFNNILFPVALAIAVLHSQSREYKKIWFE